MSDSLNTAAGLTVAGLTVVDHSTWPPRTILLVCPYTKVTDDGTVLDVAATAQASALLVVADSGDGNL